MQKDKKTIRRVSCGKFHNDLDKEFTITFQGDFSNKSKKLIHDILISDHHSEYDGILKDINYILEFNTILTFDDQNSADVNKTIKKFVSLYLINSEDSKGHRYQIGPMKSNHKYQIVGGDPSINFNLFKFDSYDDVESFQVFLTNHNSKYKEIITTLDFIERRQCMDRGC